MIQNLLCIRLLISQTLLFIIDMEEFYLLSMSLTSASPTGEGHRVEEDFRISEDLRDHPQPPNMEVMSVWRLGIISTSTT